MKQHVQTGALITFIIIGTLLGLFSLYKLAPFLLLVLIAIVFTAGIDPLVTRVQNLTARRWRPLPRALATILVMAVGALVFAGVLAFLTVTAVNESVAFAKNTWPGLQERTIALAGHLAGKYTFLPSPEAIYAAVRSQSGNIASYLLTTSKAVFGLFGTLFSGVTIGILTMFFTTFKDGITYTFAQFIPQPHQVRVLEISHLAGKKMGGWLRGQLTLALIITLIIAPAMLLLRVDYAVLIAIIGGIGELIPMLGPAVGFIPAIIIVLLGHAPIWQIVAVIVFFVVLSQAENYLFAPMIMEREVELSPVTTIIALFVGGGLLGVVGAILAIPLAAAGRVVLLEAVFPAIQGKPRQEIEANRPEARACTARQHALADKAIPPSKPKRKRPTAGASQ